MGVADAACRDDSAAAATSEVQAAAVHSPRSPCMAASSGAGRPWRPPLETPDPSEPSDTDAAMASSPGSWKGEEPGTPGMAMVNMWISSALLITPHHSPLSRQHFSASTRLALCNMAPSTAQDALAEVAEKNWEHVQDITAAVEQLVSQHAQKSG